MFHLFSSLARTSLNEPKLQSLENKVFEFEFSLSHTHTHTHFLFKSFFLSLFSLFFLSLFSSSCSGYKPSEQELGMVQKCHLFLVPQKTVCRMIFYKTCFFTGLFMDASRVKGVR